MRALVAGALLFRPVLSPSLLADGEDATAKATVSGTQKASFQTQIENIPGLILKFPSKKWH